MTTSDYDKVVEDKDFGEVVILVHGTGAAASEDVGERWWQLGSEFMRHLDSSLTSIRVSRVVFHWTGQNLESARLRAGLRLFKRMKLLKQDGVRFHLVGHSHGGSVIWHALNQAARSKDNFDDSLMSWTTVGTPFLKYVPDPVVWHVFVRWFQSLMALVLCAGSYALLIYPQNIRYTYNSIHGTVALFVATALGSFITIWYLSFAVFTAYVFFRGGFHLLVKLGNKFFRNAEDRTFEYFSGRWTGVAAEHDEAVGILQSSVVLDPTIITRREYLGIVRAVLRLSHGSIRRWRPIQKLAVSLKKRIHRLPQWTRLPIGFIGACGLLYLADLAFGHFLPASFQVSNEVLAILIFCPVTILAIVVYLVSRMAGRFLSTAIQTESMGLSSGEPIRTENTETDESIPHGLARSIELPEERVPIWHVIRFIRGDLYALIYNNLVLPIIDDFIWAKITQLAQGNDRTGYIVQAVSTVPVAGVEMNVLSSVANQELIVAADEYAAQSIAKIRRALTQNALSGKSLWKIFGDELSYRELVHNSYFHNPRVRGIITSRIQEASRSEKWSIVRKATEFESAKEVERIARIRAQGKARLGIMLMAPVVVVAIMLVAFIALIVFARSEFF